MLNVRNLRILGLVPLIFFSGCLEFKSIEQPSSVLQSEIFTIFIEAMNTGFDGQPYFGIRLPVGWTIPGDVIPCTGVYDGTIIYDSNLALEQESISPSPEGYYWWVGVGDKTGGGSESAYAELQIQTNNQAGRFSIDYMLGNSFNGLNQNRSDNHLIEVVDEYSPRELHAVVEVDMVSLNWETPFVSKGLIGYDVYQDGQIINTDLVLDTIYIDENPAQELIHYTIASLYDNGDVYFMPYEIKILVFSGGIGDPNDPYQIATAEQLSSFSIADFPYLLDKCFVLVNDINLDPNLPGGQVFGRAVIAPDTSLEDDFQYDGFTGRFDGNGFKISNLTIVGHDYLGLFGATHDNSQVWNLGIVDANVTGTGSHFGILTGYNCCNVTNCYSTGTVSGGGTIGGLVGYNEGDVTNCYNTGSVNGEEEVGGLVGYNEGDVTKCYNTGSVSGGGSTGGLVGSNHCSISKSYNNGRIIGDSDVGGLVGSNRGNVTQCYSTNVVNGDRHVGGLVGMYWSGNVKYCYSNATVSGGNDVGGLMGHILGDGYVARCYSTGQVSSTGKVGGLVGQGSYERVSSSFWDVETSGQTLSEGGIDLTTAQMMDSEFFGLNGWAGDPNWILDSGHDYPHLAWEGTPGQFIPVPTIDWMDGMGTIDNPYEVENTNQFIKIGKASILWDKHFVLCANINLIDKTRSMPVISEFWGTFEGEGFVISNLTIIGGGGKLGLFGELKEGARIMDLGIVDVNITSRGNYIGGIVGYNDGRVVYCYSTGTINGSSHIGGLIGHNNQAITDCYSTVSVSGKDYIGGLVGNNSGNIANSYSVGSVSGDLAMGGLVGDSSGNVFASFWDTETSGRWYSHRGIGKTTAEMQMAKTFIEEGWDFIDEVTNGTEDIWWIDEGKDYPRLWWELSFE